MLRLNFIILACCLVIFSIGCKKKGTEKNPQEYKEKVQFNTDNKVKQADRNTDQMGLALLTEGSFITADDKLLLKVPVTSNNFSIKEIKNISSQDTMGTNAILIRVSDGTHQSIDGVFATHKIENTESISSHKLNESELKKDGELIVLTFNSTDSFTNDEIDILKECIKENGNYKDPYSCINEIRNENNKNKKGDTVKPNDRKGSILKGS